MMLLELRHRGSYMRLWHVDTRDTAVRSCHIVSFFGDTACMSFLTVRLAPALFFSMRQDWKREEDSGEDKGQIH
jgi:hypothetical protein